MSALYHTWVLSWPGAGCNVNHMYGAGRNGQRFLSESATAYRDEVVKAVKESRWRPPAGVPLALTLEYHPPNARRRDVDGPGKLIQDAIFAALGDDDRRIVHLDVWKWPPDKGNPRVEARLSAVLGFGVHTKESA